MQNKEDLKNLSKEVLLDLLKQQQRQLNLKEKEIILQKETLASQEETLASQEETLASQEETLASQKEEALASKKIIQEKEEKIETLVLLVLWLKRGIFGSSSEKSTKEKDEPEAPTENEGSEDEDEAITVGSHTRKKGKGKGRSKLPKELPRFRREHDLLASEKVCGCGCELKHIADKVSEQLEIIPAVLFVIEHVRKQYACPACEETIKLSNMPKPMIPKSIAGPGLLAHIAVSKFCDHLPLYRQEGILRRFGVSITRATFANWMIRCGEAVAPLITLMHKKILSGEIGYADETTVQVLKEPGRKAKNKSYIWLFA